MSLTPYLMTVALHAVVLSAASVTVVAFVRNPRAKAALALGCLMATAVLSWLTPLRPAERPALSIPILPARLPEIEPAAPSPPLERVDLPAVGQESLPPTPRSKNLQLTLLVPMLWAAGTLAGLLGIAGSVRRGVRWQRSLDIADEHEWPILHDALTRKLDQDAIRISTETISPCVTGFLKPKIVLPRSLLDGTKPRELAWALRHELTHLDGHDSRWSFAIRLIRSLFWWNPIVHGLAWTWSEARERTCDQAAATTGTERADYGDFLVTMAATLSPRPTRGPSMAKHGTAKRLKRRIASLLSAAPGLPPKVSSLQAVGAALVFAAALGATSLLALEKEEPAAGAGGTAQTLEKIQNPEPIVALSLAWVKSTEPFSADRETLKIEELKKRVEELIALPGNAIASTSSADQLLPARSLRRNHTVWVFNAERENEPLLTTPPWDGETLMPPFAGWVIGIGEKTKSAQGEIRVPIAAAYSFFPGNHLAAAGGKRGPWKEIRKIERSKVLAMSDGEASVLDLGEVERGVHISLVVFARIALPWEQVEAFVPAAPKRSRRLDREIKSASPLGKGDSQLLSMTRTKPDNPELRNLEKLTNEARAAYQRAMNTIPANLELVRERDLQLEVFEKNQESREALWKLQRLNEAISANAANDPHTLALRQEWEAKAHAVDVLINQLETERTQWPDEKSRQELEAFEEFRKGR